MAASKAEYFAKKGHKKSGTERVLYEMAAGINEFTQLNDDAADSESAKPFFGDLVDSYDCSSSECTSDEEPPKESMFLTTEDHYNGENGESDEDF